MDEPTREDWEQAALWRGIVGSELRAAHAHLTKALSRCPVSIEKVQIRGALRRLNDAIATTESGAAQAARNAQEHDPGGG